ncbi:hypothetical protein SteCoe_8406 [Stentor coeruleus]|uniref:MRH domain-containing protein n=1 Tax=Stentor coeruleus TaxID=5963 RepID=A0A1R2CK44_9CILI|nr:hypothetical protein SteCoe_8406 [Stentor coeruleus]
MFILWSLLSFKAIFACDYQNFFTDCEDLGKRKVFVVPDSQCEEKSILVYEDIPCDFECASGQVLDFKKGEITCSSCPDGQYNLGGAMQIGHGGENWGKSISSFLLQCWINGIFSDPSLCITLADTDEILLSKNSFPNSFLTITVSFSVKLIKDGFITITYRKEALVAGPSGTLLLKINKETVAKDEEDSSSLWKVRTIQLEKGYYEISIEFDSKGQENNEIMVSLSSIVVFGTSFAAESCYNCPNLINNHDHSSCKFCDYNQYLESSVCQDCPLGTYSLSRSVGIESCIPKPSCTNADLTPFYSDCVNNMRNLTYIWKEPHLCNDENFNLPPVTTSLDCEKCSEGFYRKAVGNQSSCETCLPGEILKNINGTFVCEKCPAGSFAMKEVKYTEWTGKKIDFDNYCLTSGGAYCTNNIGWVSFQNYISSGTNLDPGYEVFFEKHVEIIANAGKVQFLYEILNPDLGSFDVYVDHKHILTLKTEGNYSSSLLLSAGKHKISWNYWSPKPSLQEIRIYLIKIVGSTEGGSIECEKCEMGTISKSGASSCESCPEGHTSLAESTYCAKCKNGYYNNNDGMPCMKCFDGTYSSTNHTYCHADSLLRIINENYYLGVFLNVNSSKGSLVENICGNKNSQSFCHQTFFGPILSKETEYYISILNPSIFALEGLEYLSEPKIGYLFGIMQGSESENKPTSKKECKNQDIIVNFGSEITNIEKINNGFTIDYGFGDYCTDSERYSSKVNVLCDKESGAGWPVFSRINQCKHEFTWHSKYGCPICQLNEMAVVSSECVNGKRYFSKIESDHCIFPFTQLVYTSNNCSVFYESIKKPPVIAAIIIMTLLIIVLFTCCVLYFREKREYQKLGVVE